jgi:hypothetical protein
MSRGSHSSTAKTSRAGKPWTGLRTTGKWSTAFSAAPAGAARWIATEKTFSDFELELEFKVSTAAGLSKMRRTNQRVVFLAERQNHCSLG